MLQAAKRELLEETGIKAIDDGEVIGHIYEAADWCTISNNIVKFDELSDDYCTDAEFQSEWMSIEEINALSRNGQFNDSPSLAALYFLHLFE